jgi:PIN like domain
VIDTNVLLNLYRYNESTRDDPLEVLQKVGDRLWVPHQVMKEFWRTRVGVLASRGSGTVQVLDALGKQQRASADAIRQWAKSVAAEAEFQDRLLGKIEALYTELENGIRAQAPRRAVVSSRLMDGVRGLALRAAMASRRSSTPQS